MTNQTRKAEVPLEVVDQAARAPRAPQPVQGGATEEQEPTLRAYLETVLDARWTIVALTVAAAIAGGLYFLTATPQYQSDVLVQVEDKKASLPGIDDLTSALGSTTPADTEIELLRSRMLVGSVVDQLSLDIDAKPRFFPLIGRAVARWRDADKPSNAVLGLSSFAWGGEHILVDRIDVPKRWEGKRLTLLARGGRAYDLLDPDGNPIAKGEVGNVLLSGGVSLFVSDLSAREGTRFRIARLSRDKVIEDLQQDLVIAEKGRKTGVIRVALEGAVPARVSAILDAIARTYLRQNVERKSEEAEKTLQFIKGQLPQLRSNVDAAATALKDYRAQRGGGLNLSVEAKAVLDRAADVEKALTVIELQRAELNQRFTESHSALIALTQKAAELQREREALNRQIRGLPETELRAATLMRDAKVANELYVLLLNKAQEMQVLKSGTIGNVRIIDSAPLPQEPARPKLFITISLSLFLGLAFGIAVAFARKALDQGVEDPAVIERETGLSVYATIPHSAAQGEYVLDLRKKKKGTTTPVLALAQPNDLAVEALRSLRTSLQFALADATNNVVTIGGPSPGIGKSFVSVNLAHVLADAGKRVLLVDADMRKGRLHCYFGGGKAPGLADVICGSVTAKGAVRKTGAENLHFLPMGATPPNPSELLSSGRFEDLVEWASQEYDLVLIDTAPILAVTDAAIAGRTAGTNLLVLRAGQHPIREIALAVKRMAQNGVVARALILNDVMPKAGGYAYSRYGYHYHYDYR